MAKFCISCGKQNEDGAAFCVSCGHKFPDSLPQTTPSAAPDIMHQAGLQLWAELDTGAHQHVLTDVYLRDSFGKTLLVARKPSLLHDNYTMVDGSEAVVGFLTPKMHLTHSSMTLEDPNHAALGTVQHGTLESTRRVGPYVERTPPKCWVEDPAGNRLGSVNFANRLLGFAAVKDDGSEIFEASLSGGQGLRQELSAMEHRRWAISVFDPGYPLPMILAIVVVVDKIVSG